MKQPFTKEAIIGVIAVATLAIAYFGINYLKGINIFNPSNFYYVAYDNVTDLTSSNPVYVDGFKVGQVHQIRYNYSNPGGKIIVVLDLDKALKIPAGAKASLSVSMLGSASINLELNKYVSTYHSTGDTLIGVTSLGIMNKVENELMPQLQQMLPRIDSILIALNHVVSHPALTQSLDNINTTTRNLAITTSQINTMMRNDVPVIMGNFKAVSGNLATFSNQLERIDLATAIDSVQVSITNLNRLTTNLNNPNGTIGLLLNDRQLYDNLNATAGSANQLLLDLKERPKRYVHFSIFGRKDK